MTDTATVVATVLLIAFAIDRIVAALMFTTDYFSLPRETPEKPETKARRGAYLKRFVRFFIAAVLSGIALMAFGDLTKIRLGSLDPKWNWPLLWLILVGGADRISQFLATPQAQTPAAAAGGSKGFHVEGTLTLDPESAEQLQKMNGK